MQNKKTGIREFMLRKMAAAVFISIGLTMTVWAAIEYAAYVSEKKLVQEQYINDQKNRLRREVAKLVDYISYVKSQTDVRLDSELREKVYLAVAVAENIYRENASSRPIGEIEKMVKDALRPWPKRSKNLWIVEAAPNARTSS